jgi:hypothetical protein
MHGRGHLDLAVRPALGVPVFAGVIKAPPSARVQFVIWKMTVEDPELPVPSPIEVARQLAALGGLMALVLSIAAWGYRPDAFWHAYVFAWLLAAGTSLGIVALALLGRIRPWEPGVAAVLRAGTGTAYLVAAMAIPLALNADEIAAIVRASLAGAPVDACLRGVLVGPALAAFSLSLATLASLAHHEPLVLPAPGERVLRLGLASALVVDALTTGRARGGVALALVEAALCLWLLLPLPYRSPLTCSALAFVVHAVRVRRLLASGAALAGDVRWLPEALNLLLLTALGGLWVALFLWRLDRRPPPPLAPFVEPRAPA